MNWRWKRIIICAAIGLVFGIFTAITQFSEVGLGTAIAFILVLPLSVNFLYWGWVQANVMLSKMNLFLVMSIGKWVIFFIAKFFIAFLIGYVMFPIAIVKAVKNQD